jgi:hypothetical protein
MKALSIRQPWAWLVVNGIKTVENRTWSTDFRGRVLVHAGQKFALSADEYERLRDDLNQGLEEDQETIRLPERPEDFQFGGIVGSVEIVGCVTECDDEYDALWHIDGHYAFLLNNPEVLPFKPCKGKLNFFTPNI